MSGVSKSDISAAAVTYQAHERAKSTAVAATGGGTELALDEELHDGHGRAVDGVLLVARRGASGVVEELRRLGHRHADQLRLRATAAPAAGRELLEHLRNGKW